MHLRDPAYLLYIYDTVIGSYVLQIIVLIPNNP